MTTSPITNAITQRGGSVALVAREYLWVIENAIANRPRSRQAMIGPSEIGCPCARRIGYRLLGKAPRHSEPNWRAQMGTWAHAGIQIDFETDNARMIADGLEPRWITESLVAVGQVDGQSIMGTCDLYDTVTATVIDHKTVGKTRLDHYKAHGPGDQYRVQAHLYGRGWQTINMPVDNVMIVFLPRDGQLTDAVVWSEPYDEQVAIDALDRLSGILTTVQLLPKADALAALPTADAFCWHCPYFKIGSTDLDQGCPGHPEMRTATYPALKINK